MGKHKPSGGYADWVGAVAARMKTIREEQGLTFRAAGEKTGVPFASIQRVEAGRTKPTLELLYSLAEGYGVAVSRLLCGDESAQRRGNK